MINASTAFKNASSADQRRPEGLVIINFNDELLTPTATATSQAGADTPPIQAAIGRIRPNDFKTVGNYLHSSYNQIHKGWWSQLKSDANGNFSTPQVLTIDYGKVVKNKNFWFVANQFYFPVNFTIQYESGTTWVNLFTITNNANPEWSGITVSEISFRRIRITITKVKTANENVRIYHFGMVGTVILEKDDIADFKLIEETKSEVQSPYGGLTSNELTLTLNNPNRWLAPDNVNGPFYGKIKPRLNILPYIGLEVSTNEVEFIPLGSFGVFDWSTPSNSLEAAITAYDKLYEIMNTDMPKSTPLVNTNLKSLFEYLFNILGIPSSKYQIDNSLAQISVPVGWLDGVNAGDVIQKFIEAGNCSVFITRLDIIRVKDNRQSGASIASLNDNNQIISINNNQKITNVYSTVKIDVNNHRLSELNQVASLEDTIIPPGVKTFERIKFNSTVGNIMYVKLSGNKNTKFVSMKVGINEMDLTVNNTGTEDEEIDISIMGNTIETTTVQIQSTVPDAFKTVEDKTVTISNLFIQDSEIAQSYADSLINFVSDMKAYYSIDIRGLPHLELLDLIDVQSSADKIGLTQLCIVSMNLTYSSGLEASIYARKVIN